VTRRKLDSYRSRSSQLNDAIFQGFVRDDTALRFADLVAARIDRLA
jgi:hypothetical protein